MNIASLALTAIRHKPLHSALNISAIALGMAMLTCIFLISTGIQDGLKRSSGGIDVVAGAKGSPLQLILSSVYHSDVPIGNIDISEFEKIRRNPLVRQAIPIAIGDNFKGWRVVGTTPDYLELYKVKPVEGRLFKESFEVVAGHATAMKIGEEFAARHGFDINSDDAHDAYLYKVVGILPQTGTVLDKLLMTHYQSVQQLHAHPEGEGHTHDHQHDEKENPEEQAAELAAELAMGHQITAVLIQARNGAALMNLPRLINKSEHIQAANPSYELTRLSKSFGVGQNVLNALGLSILILSILILFASLASSLAERRHDMAVLRVLGASPFKLFSTLMIEGVIISGLGTLIGIVTGHLLAYGLTGILGSFEGILVKESFLSLQKWDMILFFIGCGAGLCAAFPASISAAKTDISKLLVKG